VVNREYQTLSLLLKHFCIQVSMRLLRGLVHDPTLQRGILLICRGLAGKQRRRRTLASRDFSQVKRMR
jgi:hypothetical protein